MNTERPLVGDRADMKEPDRMAAGIQPHGFLITTCAGDPTVRQASANIGDFLDCDAASAPGRQLRELFGADGAALLEQAVATPRTADHPSYLGTICLPGGAYVDALVHAADGLLIFEFEPVARTAHADFYSLYPLIGTFLGHLTDVDEVAAMCEVAARTIRDMTGFGQVLVYRFDRAGHGNVLAEASDPAYRSYLHQRFPASDTPQYKRELYTRNRLHVIHDTGYRPAPLVPPANPLTGAPTELRGAALRSVSPQQVDYLGNMGVRAAMSVSVVVKGRLWGMISCHHAEPKSVPFESRAACEQLGQILALRIESREEADDYAGRLELRRMLVQLLAALSQGPDFVDNICSVSHELLRFAGAAGAALSFEGRLVRFGDAPEESDVRDLVQWLSSHARGDLFHTDALPTAYPPAAAYKARACGILALPISQIHRHYLIWFRPEVAHSIEWAGEPGQGDAPRASFDAWRETVLGTSLPWSQAELDTAMELRSAVLGVVLQRAEQMAELAEELARVNKELESFSYSVSHDLRAPLRHIVGFADLLLEFESGRMSERGNRFLRNIKDSARFAGKLVDDLLSFSQMGRAALRIDRIDMNELVGNTIDRLMQDQQERAVAWRVAPLPAIDGDAAFLQLALYNLLSNALKYTRTRPQAEIAVSAELTAAETVFHVRDNGVGFNMEYAHKLFGVFQRLHRMEEFEGTGIGLANVRRIVERHGGRVAAVGAPDEGATFTFAIPRQSTEQQAERHAKTDTSR